MRTACFCGTVYDFVGKIGQCPNCPHFVCKPPLREEDVLRALEDEVLDFIDSATKVC